ncbi:caveolin-2 isoform 2-T2 [Vipera latastei]
MELCRSWAVQLVCGSGSRRTRAGRASLVGGPLERGLGLASSAQQHSSAEPRAKEGATDRWGKGRRPRAQPRNCAARLRLPRRAIMGLEKEKMDTKIFMDEDGFNRSNSPAPSETDKNLEKAPDRDPHGLNSHLKLGFEDVIAEPTSTHSFDKVWVCSHALFEYSKYLIYKLLTLVLAIPLALVAGILFAVLSCLHIWNKMETQTPKMKTRILIHAIHCRFIILFLFPGRIERNVLDLPHLYGLLL